MTDLERDNYIKESHDTLMALKPMVEAHQRSLYGNGRPGLENRVTVIEATHSGRSGLAATVGVVISNVTAIIAVAVAMLRKS